MTDSPHADSDFSDISIIEHSGDIPKSTDTNLVFSESESSVDEEFESQNQQIRNYNHPALSTQSTSAPKVEPKFIMPSVETESATAMHVIHVYHMPLPSSDGAPKFNGRNLRRFLQSYELGVTEARWDDQHKCKELYKYCKRSISELVERIPESSGNDWSAMVKALSQLFNQRLHEKRYTRSRLERFVQIKREINSKNEFALYNQEFLRIYNGLQTQEQISERDRNKLFWNGLPKVLMKDILQFLAQAGETVDNYTAPAIGKVTKAALLILDTNSIFSGLRKSMRSHNRSKSHRRSDKKQKHRVHWLSSSEEDSDGSSDEESSDDDRGYSSRTKTTKKLRTRPQWESSSEDNDDSYSSNADSESETSDYRAKKSHMNRKR